MSKRIRVVTLLLGVLLVGLAIAAEKLGLDTQEGWGSGELLLLSLGLLILLLGYSGARALDSYRALALVLLNTLVLITLIELTATGLFSLGIVSEAEERRKRPDAPYYDAQRWSKIYWREHARAGGKRYQPFVEWRRRPFAGETIRIDQRGVRETPGADCREGALVVFMFGGSTMWGWGATAELTIPALLQSELSQRLQEPVCTINFGEDSYVSTQEIITLILELQRDHVPSLVIFLDGINDVSGAYSTGVAGYHQFRDQMKALLEPKSPGWLRVLQGSQTARLVRLVRERTEEASVPTRSDPQSLAEEVTRNYAANHEIIAALAKQYGFDAFLFWQPALPACSKRLTPVEEKLLGELDPGLVSLFEEVYPRVRRLASETEGIFDLSSVLDSYEGQMFIDPVHTTPVGNELISERMLDAIEGSLTRKW